MSHTLHTIWLTTLKSFDITYISRRRLNNRLVSQVSHFFFQLFYRAGLSFHDRLFCKSTATERRKKDCFWNEVSSHKNETEYLGTFSVEASFKHTIILWMVSLCSNGAKYFLNGSEYFIKENFWANF